MAPRPGPAGTRNLSTGEEGGGGILLVGDGGRPRPVGQGALGDLFRVCRDNVRVVILNACYTRPAAEAIARVVDCVIGTNRAVGDDAARVFAARFYRSLADGRSVRQAFDEARVELRLQGFEGEADNPELIAREGADPAQCYLPAASPAHPPSGSGPPTTQYAVPRHHVPARRRPSPRAAGIDAHADMHTGCVPPESAPAAGLTPHVRRFGAYTADLRAIADHLAAAGVTTVALESARVYWVPLFDVPEVRGFEVLPAGSRSAGCGR